MSAAMWTISSDRILHSSITVRSIPSPESARRKHISPPPALPQEFGLIFSHCRITGEEPDSVYLGRPWRDCAKTAFICCELGDHICPEGWQNWGKVRAEVLSDYIEYGNFGPGADCSGRSPLSRCLVNPEVETYFSKENVLVGEDGWIPAE